MLRCCVVLPFNWDDARRAAKLDWKRLQPADVKRDALKDDIKIIAQATRIDAEFVITNTLKDHHSRVGFLLALHGGRFVKSRPL